MKALPLLLLVLLQDGARRWERPVEIDRGDYIVALAVEAKGGSIRVDAIDFDADGNLRIGRRESADGGASWQRNLDCPVGLLDVYALLPRENGIVAFLALPDGGYAVWDIDAKTGRKRFNEPFSSDHDLEEISQATLLDYKGDLWLLCTEESEAYAYQSKDGGKTWAVRNKGWECRADAGTALMFESGGTLHVMFADGHYSTDDQGKTWKSQSAAPGVPMAVAVGARVSVISGTPIEKSDALQLQAYSSADGGATWTAGGNVCSTHDDPDSPRPSLIASGDRLAFFDNDWFHEGDELKITTIAMLSEDGGKTWDKIDFKNGMARDSAELLGVFIGKDLVVVYSNFEKYARTDEIDPDEDDHVAIPGYLLVRRWTDRKPPGPLTDDELRQIAAWIVQLGDGELAVREKAEKNLLKLGDRALPLFDKAAAETADAEIKSRLAALQKHYRAEWWK